MRRAVVTTTSLLCLAGLDAGAAPPAPVSDPAFEAATLALFEAPAARERRTVPRPRSYPGSPGVVRCAYYPDYTVKELDFGDHGDNATSVTPVQPGTRRPPCGVQDDPGEVILRNGAGGYVMGARDGFVFVISTYGHDGSPFGIYDRRTGRLLFTDIIAGEPSAFAAVNGVLTLGYTRSIHAGCSIVTGGQACWAKLARQARLPPEIASQSAPVLPCEAAYRASPLNTGWDQFKTDPSVIAYDVRLSLDKAGVTRALSLGVVACQPQN